MSLPQYGWNKDMAAASSPVTIRTPGSGLHVKPVKFQFSVSNDCTVKLYYGSDVAANRIMNLTLEAGQVCNFVDPYERRGAADAVLYMSLSAGTVTGRISGFDEA